MVRTAAGIRISAGRSSKKVSKAGGTSTSSPGSSNKSKTGSSSSKLPPIPFQETPSWQKPITNFFKSNSPLKAKENKSEDIVNNDTEENDPEPTSKKLKLDEVGEENNSEHEESDEVQNSEENNESKNCEETLEENKENSTEFDEGAGGSKD